MEFFFALVLFIALIVVLAIIVYNKIVKLKVRVEEGWSDIKVQLKRRHDLIGNLVETVKGYATHEKETLEKVTQARNTAKQAEGGNIEEVQSAERMLTNALSGLKINALAEAYPDLKANTNFLELQRELSDTENKIAASRRFYNTTVKALNTYITQIPGRFFASMASAKKAEFFEVEEDQKVEEVPNVDFHSTNTPAPTPASPPAPAPKPKTEEKPAEPTPEKKEQPKTEEKPVEPAPAKTEEPKAEEKQAESVPEKTEEPKAEEKQAESVPEKTEEPKAEEKQAESVPEKTEEPKVEEKPTRSK